MPVYTLKQPPKLNVFGHCYLISRLTKMIRTILADHAEKVAKTFGASKWLRHTLKMRFAEKVQFFLPSWLFVFSHCFHISRLTKMIRTILESADHAEKVAKTIVPSKWLRHTLKIRFAEKIHIFLPSYLYVFSQCDLISGLIEMLCII